MIELIAGKKYYGRYGSGWVVLVNGQPHHEPTKQEAIEFIKRLPHHFHQEKTNA